METRGRGSHHILISTLVCTAQSIREGMYENNPYLLMTAGKFTHQPCNRPASSQIGLDLVQLACAGREVGTEHGGLCLPSVILGNVYRSGSLSVTVGGNQTIFE